MGQDQARRRRFIAFPFPSGCRSRSSVDVVVDTARHAGKKPQEEAGSESGRKGESLVARLLRGFKNLSQIFAAYECEEDEEEMVIGLPTDVKHVAHMGWDGSTATTTSLRSWNRAAPQQQQQQAAAGGPPLPALSARQFELAMAAQAAAADTTARHRPHS